jgi:hypothetical protein
MCLLVRLGSTGSELAAIVLDVPSTLKHLVTNFPRFHPNDCALEELRHTVRENTDVITVNNPGYMQEVEKQPINHAIPFSCRW